MDNAGNESGYSIEVSDTPKPIVITVKTDGTGDFTVIQTAIDVSTNGDTVLVHPGTDVEKWEKYCGGVINPNYRRYILHISNCD